MMVPVPVHVILQLWRALVLILLPILLLRRRLPRREVYHSSHRICGAVQRSDDTFAVAGVM